MSRKLIAIPFAALILTAAAPAPSVALASNGQGNSAASQSDQSGDESKAERKICKRYDMSGSHMRSKRLCLTKAQWKEFDAAQEN